MKKLLQFVDDLLEDVYKLMTGGIEGTHYELNDDGSIEFIDMDLWQQEVQPLSSSSSEVTFSFKDTDPEKNSLIN